MSNMRIHFLTSLAGLLFLAAASALAGVIPIGLDWRKNVFVQEVWIDAVPSWTIANLGKEPVAVSVFERKAEQPLAGPWIIPAGGVVTQEVKSLVGKNLVTLKLKDGSALGMIFAPGDEKPEKGAIVSYYGLSGSGGRQTKQWIEQPKEPAKSGQVFELTLKVPAKVGAIRFPPQNSPGSIQPLVPIEVVSATLPIAKDKQFEIDTQKPTKDQAIHTVTLRFKAPVVERATKFMVNGQQTLPGGGGMGITRGIVVIPTAAK
jgi:hypothetical protein